MLLTCSCSVCHCHTQILHSGHPMASSQHFFFTTFTKQYLRSHSLEARSCLFPPRRSQNALRLLFGNWSIVQNKTCQHCSWCIFKSVASKFQIELSICLSTKVAPDWSAQRVLDDGIATDQTELLPCVLSCDSRLFTPMLVLAFLISYKIGNNSYAD